MDKYYRMSKSNFLELHHRQQLSGLTVVDFCAQEGISKSSYYHWRSRFGITDRSTVSDPVPPEKRMIPITVRNNTEVKASDACLSSASPSSACRGGITICLAAGVKVRFDGDSCGMAMDIITKLLGHVLP